MTFLGPLPTRIRYLQSLLNRARELETANPIISYFCKLHAVKQILQSKLHVEDPDVKKFATALLDDVEKSKTENPQLTSEHGQSILSDDTVARAYVEAFALKVFAKADKDIYEKMTTKSTANAFAAAAVFYDVVRSFDTATDAEIAEKIKYSKYQAARILRAYKNNEDPNEYEPPELEDQRAELNDETMFPDTENAGLDTNHTGNLDNEPTLASSDRPKLSHQSGTSPLSTPNSPESEHSFLSPSNSQEISSSVSVAASQPHNQIPDQPHIYTRDDAERIMNRTTIISSAQKQAKFAISALNYEDIDTAVKELTNALNLLSNLPKD